MKEYMSFVCSMSKKSYRDSKSFTGKQEADIHKCIDNETSSLYIACHNNNIKIAQILLNNKAYIDKCRYDETSPLCCACICILLARTII